MPTPSQLVTDAFAQANGYAATAQTQLTLFTDKLNAAIQTAPLMDLSFSAIADPGASTVQPYVAPATYTSPLLTSLADVITTRLAGGTGITPAVETAIWDRARERELATAQAAIDQVTRDTEALGYDLPTGVMNDGIRRATRDYYDKVSALSRDVAIKQADLEQSNMQAAIDKAIGYEATLSEILARRSQVSIAAFQADVQRFTAEVDQDVKHWEVQIKQYEAQANYIMAGSKLNTEVTRANLATVLEAAKTGSQVYAQLVASAYSLIHASASVSASAGMSVGYSYSNDTDSAPPSVTAV
jgi:hypothetical protein